MEDVQNQSDYRRVFIDEVGVSGLRYPMTLIAPNGNKRETVGLFSLAVDLLADVKGTHLSRFVEILNASRFELGLQTIGKILGTMRDRLGASQSFFKVTFPYFIERSAPVSGATALIEHEATLKGELSPNGSDITLGVRVPVTSLCPCSKAISDYGAHNQRGEITIEVRTARTATNEQSGIWFDDLIDVAVRSSSAPVYTLLKRSDERHVTMQAYDNPLFVEDMVRGVAVELEGDSRISWFSVQVVNYESIHNHNAFARVGRFLN
jgi:GTP cyclohydrolase IB